MNDISKGNPADKVAIVTGAASGLGRAIAERLAADGARVVVADISDKGAGVAAAIGGHFVKGDSAQRADCKALVDAALAKYGTVHILVNNAGFQHVSAIEDFPEDMWDRMQAVMLTAPFLLTRYCWPAMKKQQWGRIVNISSIHGLIASPNKAGYIAAKHGLVGLTRTAALEGGACGITANAICPGYVWTPLVEQQIDDQAKSHGISRDRVIKEVLLAKQPSKKFAETGEIGALAVFLASDAAQSITGTALPVDGGWTAQ